MTITVSKTALLTAAAGVLVLAVVGVAAVASNGDDSSSGEPTEAPAHALSIELSVARAATTDTLGMQGRAMADGTYAGKTCWNDGGFADVPGATVTVTDANGKIVGAGRVPMEGLTEGVYRCGYTFAVSSLPAAEFYTVKINHRTGPTWTRSQLDASAWRQSITLG